MAYNVEDFLPQNVASPVVKEEVHLKRFKSPFVVKSLTADETDRLRKQATRTTYDRKTRQQVTETDQNKFSDLLLAASVVEPDLHDEKLQKAYGAIGEPAQVLKSMLNMGEYNAIAEKVMDISDLDEDGNDLIDQAKN